MVHGPFTWTSVVPLRTAKVLVVKHPLEIVSGQASSPTPGTIDTAWPLAVDWAFSAVNVVALELVSARMITVWMGPAELWVQTNTDRLDRVGAQGA